MELILKSNNEQSLAKIIALAKRLDVAVVQKDAEVDSSTARDKIKDRILNFKAKGSSSFGDASDWQRQQREDRELPLS
ncbi:hypothetical protein HQ865_06120 [Mucilaginibacter mali]|uniref:Uncharacterized protein n=1 Tax=Mucilaginibacter mali TaxID=2740462 RepID=A0A7D4QQX9_9SPHI|nr:hypothetical protein [Mucilaginibacter mali]QKJ29349.1 hypothetical protein HQ865_06120 [Mucilaginibacter mali]